MTVYFIVAFFSAALAVLALWGAWLGWTRSKSPTARYFVTAMALAWVVFIGVDAWKSYQIFKNITTSEVAVTAAAAPLYREYRDCQVCYEGPAGDVYVVAASKMQDALYVFQRETPYSLRFESGQVRFNDRILEPGCYTGEAEVGDTVEITGARSFRLEAGEEASCD